ncbi:MAG: DUF3575 domain-containing protein [Alistipes sp.]|jgi:hypothetical protein|nr:DUF3575 domain-containing protein [Alistipes sp.]
MNRTNIIKLLATTAALFILGTAGAQSQRLTIPRPQMSAIDLFSEIRSQTGLGVAYNASLIDPARVVAFTRSTMTVDEAVETVLHDTGATYRYEGRVIVLDRLPEAPKPAAQPVVEKRAPIRTYNSGEHLTQAPRQPAVRAQLPVPTIAPQIEVPAPVSKWREASGYTAGVGKLPSIAIKTNLLYGAATLTPNLSVEFGLGKKTTLEFGASHNPWNLKGSLESNRKLVHMILKPEFRYWLCERFDGHFFGVHALFSRYNIGTYNVPPLFKKAYRYDGYAFGAGITYGYSLSLAKRWSAEFAVGVGAMKLSYDRFDCAACNLTSQPDTKTYIGPTNASASLVFLIK